MTDKTRRCLILRGVPGSGKSSMAEWLAETFAEAYLANSPNHFETSSRIIDCVKKYALFSEDINKDRIIATIHSTDQYLYEDGVYKWAPNKVGPSHAKNYQAFCQSIDKGIPLVIVDNTNTTRKEYSKYQEYAAANGYWVTFMVMPHPSLEDAVKRNTHNVPVETIEKMIRRFE